MVLVEYLKVLLICTMSPIQDRPTVTGLPGVSDPYPEKAP